MSSDAATAVTLVGGSPAVVVLPLLAWKDARKGRLGRIVLVPTDETLATGAAARIAAWLEEHHKVPVELLDPFDAADPFSGRGPQDRLRKWLQDRSANAPILLNLNPGMALHVALALQALPTGTPIVYQHPGTDSCEFIEWKPYQRTALKVPDLGFAQLLELRGAGWRITEASRGGPGDRRFRHLTLPGDAVLDVEVTLDGQRIHLDAAVERGGRLHGLICVAPGRNGDKIQLGRDLQYRRDLLARGMEVSLTVATTDGYLLRRLAGTAVHGIHVQRVQSWEIPPAPAGAPESGQFTAESPLDIPAPTPPAEGPKLAVWLGPDPSATLVSLFTHRPSEAWLYFDAGNPGVVRAMERLRDSAEAEYFPGTTLHFRPSRGRGELLQREPGMSDDTRLDLTPGTKLDMVGLLRSLPGKPWAIWHSAQVSLRLDQPQERASLGAPDITTQAWSCGGAIDPQYFGNGYVRMYADVLEAAREVFLDHLGPDVGITAQGPVDQFNLRFAERLRQRRLRMPNSMQVMVPSRLVEVVLAHVLLVAGADEVVSGLRWEFGDHVDENDLRDEVDVVARFGGRFVAVESKASRQALRAEAKARSHAALSRRVLGTMAASIVVLDRHVLPKEALEIERRTQCRLWPLRMALDPAQVRVAIEQVLASVRPFGAAYRHGPA